MSPLDGNPYLYRSRLMITNEITYLNKKNSSFICEYMYSCVMHLTNDTIKNADDSLAICSLAFENSNKRLNASFTINSVVIIFNKLKTYCIVINDTKFLFLFTIHCH